MRISEKQRRWCSAALGVIAAVFGVLLALFPRWGGRVSGIQHGDEPSVATAIRSIGVRDVVLGVGLWSAATHDGSYAPWLLARMLSDGGDGVGTLLAIRLGVKNRAFLRLSVLAWSAALSGGALWFSEKRARQKS